MRCADCLFYVINKPNVNGRCHRNAPVSHRFLDRKLYELVLDALWDKLTDEQGDMMSDPADRLLDLVDWPLVSTDEWCGQFEAKTR